MPDPVMAAAVLAHLEDQLARGELVGAYDTAEGALRGGVDHPRIRYGRVLALARMGATETAARDYAELGLGAETDVDSRALHARILKDRALGSSGHDRTAALRSAAAAYAAIHEETGDGFPGINATTLALLAGDAGAARDRARRVLDALADEGGGYWAAATRGEALLVLEDAEGAAGALAAARRIALGRWGDLASTRRQVVLLLDAPPLALMPRERMLEALRPPRVAHLTGAGTDVLPHLLREHDVGFVVLSLWGEASVAAAEAALAAGAELTLVLPCERAALIRHAEASLGPAEAERRAACLAGARTVVEVTADGDHVDERLVEYAGLVAGGVARIRARSLVAECVDLPAAGEAAAGGLRGGAVSAAGATPVRELRSLLFADVKGFSRIAESDLPTFWSRFMAEIATRLDAAGEDILFRNSWGDAVFCVAARAEAAAELALAMQERAAELRRDHPASPSLRIGLHHGPVFRGWDPVRGTPAYFGTQVSRAARVEPVVPPGDVYVTEPFAAVLAAAGAHRFEADYVGIVPLHKAYGEHRLYRLARRAAGA